MNKKNKWYLIISTSLVIIFVISLWGNASIAKTLSNIFELSGNISVVELPLDHIINPEKTPSVIEIGDSTEASYKLGEAYREAGFSINNKDLVIAYVNEEPITFNEFAHIKAFDEGAAYNLAYAAPSEEQIFYKLVLRKIKVIEARRQNLYPSDSEISDYIKEQKELMALKDVSADVESLLKGWGISEDEYFSLMRGIWADLIATDKLTEKIVVPRYVQADTVEEDIRKNYSIYLDYEQELLSLYEQAKITITDEGYARGIDKILE